MKICFNLLITFTLLLGGCAQRSHTEQPIKHSPPLHINYALFAPASIEIPSALSLFQLTDVQKRHFLNYYHRQLEQDVKPHQALANYMQAQFTDFTYYGETFDASTAILQAQGNCMSLAMITSAYAKLINLEYDYKKVNSQPIFDKQNGYLLVSSHVQTRLFDPTYEKEEDSITVLKPMVIVDYFPSTDNYPGKLLEEKTFVAKYYVNLAAQKIVDGRLDDAFHYSMKALEYDDQYSGAINILAVLHKQKGDHQTADSLYQYGLFYDENNVRLLSNYLILLKSQHRLKDINIQQAKLDKLDDPNPYAWLEQAYAAQHDNQSKRATRYYKKALDIAPYLQPAYLGLYQIYLENNRNKEAKAILQQALYWTHEPDEKQRYKYKLYQLSNRY
ncbi:hypothetical protein SOPP22_02230 [Shewanella sp. OPT22]|nr:hypothetical protein SOPP22_02230 [Shewanella sp. OPT22]